MFSESRRCARNAHRTWSIRVRDSLEREIETVTQTTERYSGALLMASCVISTRVTVASYWAARTRRGKLRDSLEREIETVTQTTERYSGALLMASCVISTRVTVASYWAARTRRGKL